MKTPPGARSGERGTRNVLPVGGGLFRSALRAPHPAFAPDSPVRQGRGGGIEQDDGRVETVHSAARPVHAPAVAKDRRQTTDLNMPVIAGTVAARLEHDLGERLGSLQGVNDQRNRGAVAAEQSK